MAPQLYDKLSARTRNFSLSKSIARDLAELMNCSIRSAHMRARSDSPMANSVLNYGVPLSPLLGDGMIDPERIAAHTREIMRRFEPRVVPASIQVQARSDTDRWSRQVLYLDISGKLKDDGGGMKIRLAFDASTSIFSAANA